MLQRNVTDDQQSEDVSPSLTSTLQYPNDAYSYVNMLKTTLWYSYIDEKTRAETLYARYPLHAPLQKTQCMLLLNVVSEQESNLGVAAL